ncbi:hypothetical protein GCM10011321_29020 [Youhaiella tibetensis]|uniref:MmcQ/YjbR family DNA-binding protein n=1 Tax=Paradevosia tibetensis TaxID=1447062 RepID=A0A5B9DL46_9HYPH|nr:MmcQ/YjbR family DNA-binding protein [Youhaiella tibetensis]QEE19108.1 MmcQ/YjbR family DNA-binding protein [Youhaiella tibetensis]GGF36263.1 hypothetical protein GCM10011321_29020 [Youhaiella tibetensis]
MSIRSRAGFEDFVSGLPATSIVHQWGDASVAKVGGKVFALFGLDAEGSGLVFKVTEFTFDMLTEADDIAQAPYFAKRGWVRVGGKAALSEEDLEAYLREAHRLVASKLTRKLQAELELTELIAAGPRRS